MIPKFKDRISFHGLLLEAAKRRVLDTPHAPAIDQKVLNRIARGILESIEGFREQGHSVGTPIGSFKEISFLKDFKLYLNIINSQVGRMEEVVRSDSKEAIGTLREMQKEVVTINAEVEEKEVELLGNYSKVTLNNFSRANDGQIEYTDRSWLIDFKTGFSFMERYLMDIIPSSGAVLPIKEYVKVPIIDAQIIDERSDTGDSVKPFIKSNPRNVFLKNKIFKYAVVRQEFDTSSRRYRIKTSFDEYPYSCTSTMTLQVELGNVVQANTLKIEPLGDSTIVVKSIKYINESGEEIGLNSSTIQTHTETVLLFEPVFTKYFIIEFQQLAHVSKTTVTTGDKRVKSINKMLSSSGFTLNLPHIESNISGRVYDFSLKEIEVGLSAYENKGIFRGEPTIVSSPVGMEINATVESIVPGVEFSDYLNLAILPEGNAIHESYVGVRLFDKEGNRRVDTICPVLDTGLVQLEFLAPVSELCRYKLFPDLDWTSQKICIADIELYSVCEEEFAEGMLSSWLEAYPGELPGPESLEPTTMDAPGAGSGGIEAEAAPLEPKLSSDVSFDSTFRSTPGREQIEEASDTNADKILIEDWNNRYGQHYPETSRDRAWGSSSPEGITIVPPAGSGGAWDVDAKRIDQEIVKRFDSKGVSTPSSAMNTYVTYKVSDETLKRFFTPGVYDTIGEETLALIKSDPITFLGIGGSAKGGSRGDEVIVEGRRLYPEESGLKDTNRKFFSVRKVASNNNAALNQESFTFEITFAESLKRQRKTSFGDSERIVINHLKQISDIHEDISHEVSKLGTGERDLALKKMNKLAIEERNLLIGKKFGYRWDPARKNTVLVDNSDGTAWPSPKLARINKGVKRKAGPSGIPSPQMFSMTATPDLIPEPGFLEDSFGKEVDWDTVEIQSQEPEEECETWNMYYRIITDSDHGLSAGDIVTLNIPGYSDYDGAVFVVSYVDSSSSFYVLVDDDARAVETWFNENGAQSVCFFGNQHLSVDLLEVYKNNQLLKIGEDYEISMDDGSTWYNEWPSASILNSHFYRNAGAGRFYVKLIDYDRSNIYWTKYFVKRNQFLSSCKQINLKNGRVVFNENLKFTSGTLQPIIISRTNTTHPYVTSLLAEFYLAIQSRNIENNPTANVTREFIRTYLSGDSLNGS